MVKLNILVIGSGGREHALAWKISQSPRVGNIYVAPGNGGTLQVATNVSIEATDIEALLAFAKSNNIYLAVVGPDAPLALGVVDAFRESGIRVFGPTRLAAEIESSKVFSKKLMINAGIPTAAFEVFRDYDEAINYVRNSDMPVVVKASGLALGKGVYICKTYEQAELALKEIMLDLLFDGAGSEVIVEEYLEGEEISVHAFCDGKTFALFPLSQDHKPINDGDKGKNTGGMGVVSPISWVNADLENSFGDLVVLPTLKTLKNCGRQFTGLLYPGLKITTDGPKVLEFNARFGDPETQSYMRLLKTDLLDILEACTDGKLAKVKIDWYSGFSACIILASGGYPDKYNTGFSIRGVEQAELIPNVVIFHAGTVFDGDLKTSGGRVLAITSLGETLDDAISTAYKAVQLIKFDGMQYRHDIGAKALAKSGIIR